LCLFIFACFFSFVLLSLAFLIDSLVHIVEDAFS
jgi:hypothetical protein